MQRRVLLSCLFLSACSGGLEDNEDFEAQAQVVGTKTPVSYYKDIKPIIDQKCTSCHAEGEGGHFSLLTYNAVKPLSSVIKQLVSDGTMPPWRASGELGVFIGDRRLTDSEKSKIVGWVEQGSPEGSASGRAAAPVTPNPSKLAKVDLTLQMLDPYTPKPARDDYRCFLLDWPGDNLAPKVITGVGVVPTDKELVHDATVYVADESQIDALVQRDGADDDTGWPCASGPGNATWIGTFGPGGGGELNPAGVGFQIKQGAHLVLQVHYNTLHKGGTDQSKVELTLAPANQPVKVGTPHVLVDKKWLARGLLIPANEADVVHRWEGRPETLPTSAGAVDILWADIRMHTLGTKGSVGIVRANGTREQLLNIPAWSFEWPQTYKLAKPVRLQANDKLWVECHYDNTESMQPVIDGERAPVRDQNWGEATTDEVCIGNVLTASNVTVNPGTGTVVPGPQPGVPDAGPPARPDAGVARPTDAGVRPNPGTPTPRPTPSTPTPRPTPDAGRNPPATNPNCTTRGSTGSGPSIGSVDRTVRTGNSGSSGSSVSRCQ